MASHRRRRAVRAQAAHGFCGLPTSSHSMLPASATAGVVGVEPAGCRAEERWERTPPASIGTPPRSTTTVTALLSRGRGVRRRLPRRRLEVGRVRRRAKRAANCCAKRDPSKATAKRSPPRTAAVNPREAVGKGKDDERRVEGSTTNSIYENGSEEVASNDEQQEPRGESKE